MDIGEVNISPNGISKTAGENASVVCSVTITPYPLPLNVPGPMLEWLHNTNSMSLPQGVVRSDANETAGNYTTTLLFLPLRENHRGTYTCRLVNSKIRHDSSITLQICMLTENETPRTQNYCFIDCTIKVYKVSDQLTTELLVNKVHLC